jgi:hypothetical protein
MMMKKTVFTILIQFIMVVIIVAQTNNNYVVLQNNDTVGVRVIKKTMHKIVCEVNGVKTKYKPKLILAYKTDDEEGESFYARPMIFGFKKWIFMERLITGKANMYEITGTMTSTSSQAGGGVTKSNSTVSVYFYRKESEGRGVVHKFVTWKGLYKFFSEDCPAFAEKEPSPKTIAASMEDFHFYNLHCK